MDKLLAVIMLTICLIGCNRSNTFQGYVEGEYSYLASAVSGNLTKLFVSRGQRVEAQQPVFILDPEPEFHKLQEARSTLASAQQHLIDLEKGSRQTILDALEAQQRQAAANLDLSQKTLARYETLLVNKAIDKESVDQARSTNEQNKQRLKEIEANLAEAKLGARENLIQAQKAEAQAADAAVKQAEWALTQKSIRTPTHGQIIDTLFLEGEFVTAGNPVVILLPPEKIKIVFYVPEKIVGSIHVNDVITFDCDGCKQTYQAKIAFISPRVEFTPPVIYSKDSRDKLVFRVEAYPSISDAVMLNPGQPVDVKIIKN